jgi:hypothetical protein
MLLWQERSFSAFISLQAICGKSLSDHFRMQSQEILPLKVSNIMCLATGQSSGRKTNVVYGKLVRAIGFGLDIIVIFEFGMSLIDVRHSALV